MQDPDKVAAAQRRYRETHREELIERGRRYRETHREERRETWKRWAEANIEDVAAARREWSRQYRAKHKPWQSPAGRANVFAWTSNRRAQAMGITSRISGGEIRELVGPCAYCGSKQTGWDHVIPLVRGGENTRANLVPCCTLCNRRKRSKLIEELGWIVTR